MHCAYQFDTVVADLTCVHLAEGVGALTRVRQFPRMAALIAFRQLGSLVIMTVATHENEPIITTGQAAMLCKKFKLQVGVGATHGVGTGKTLSVYKSNDGMTFAHMQDFRCCFETQMGGVTRMVAIRGDAGLMVFRDGSWHYLMVETALEARLLELMRQPTDLFVSRPFELGGKIAHLVSTFNSYHAIVMFIDGEVATFGCTHQVSGNVLFGGDARYAMIARVEFQNGEVVAQVGRFENAAFVAEVERSFNSATRSARRRQSAAGGKMHPVAGSTSPAAFN